MAINEQTTSAPQPNQPQGGFAQGAAPEGVAAAPSTDAPGGGPTNILGLMSVFGVSTGISPDIEAYITDLKKHLKEAPNLNISISRLQEPLGTHFVECASSAFLLLFPDVIPTPTDPEVPKSEYIRVALTTLSQVRPDLRPKNAILVSKQDYGRARHMAGHLARNLMVATNSQYASITAQALSDGNYVIDANPAMASNFINMLNPHEVQPRADIGFTVSIRRQRTPGREFQQGLVDELTQLAACTGYVEMIRQQDQAGNIKHLPLVHITAMDSMIPHPAMIPLLATLAADRFIIKNGWRNQFSKFAKGAPNLGNLIPDPQDPSKPWFASNVLERDQFIATHVFPPALAIDVVEGQARIPAIANYPLVAGAPKVLEDIRSFFGVDVTQLRNIPLTSVSTVDVIGYYGDRAGNLLDSRNIGYLDLMASLGALDRDAEALLYHQTEPRRRQRVVAQAAGATYVPMFTNNVTVLNANLLNFMSSVIGQTLRITQAGGSTGVASVDFAIAQGLGFGAFQTVALDPTRAPLATIPYVV